MIGQINGEADFNAALGQSSVLDAQKPPTTRGRQFICLRHISY
jgi:hypothetical protein